MGAVDGGWSGCCRVRTLVVLRLLRVMGASKIGEDGHQGRRSPAEESAGAPAVPTGSSGTAVQARWRSSPNEWAENAPQPNRTSGPSAKARGTIDVTGNDAGRQSLT